MITRLPFKKAALFIGIIGIFIAIFSGSVHAQESAGLTIIPPKFELFANPGDVINESVRVTNQSGAPQTLSIVVEDFRSAGELGEVVLEESESETYSLSAWISPGAPAIVISPGDEVVFPFTINVPRDAEPGGHYASVLFQIGGSENVPGVTSVRTRIGALVLLRVSGDVIEEGVLESFEAPSYSQTGPIEFTLRARNNGTTHIRPAGTIIVTNLFGRKVAELPLNGLNIFPGAIRKMDTKWEKDNIFGIYTATLVATYGQQNLPLTASTRFTVASRTGIALLVVGVIALYALIMSLVRGKGRLLKAIKIILTGR